MDTISTLTVFTMEIGELRKRVETACEAIAHVRARLHPFLEEILSPEASPKAGPAGDAGTAARGKQAQREKESEEERSEREQAFAALGQCIELVTALLPGLVSLTPEERRRREANPPDKEAMDEFLANYVPPERPPDTAPTAEERMVEEARELGERSALIGKVQAAFKPLVNDLVRVHDLLSLRLGRFGIGAEPEGNN